MALWRAVSGGPGPHAGTGLMTQRAAGDWRLGQSRVCGRSRPGARGDSRGHDKGPSLACEVSSAPRSGRESSPSVRSGVRPVGEEIRHAEVK